MQLRFKHYLNKSTAKCGIRIQLIDPIYNVDSEAREKNAQRRIKREVMEKMRVKNARKSVSIEEKHERVRDKEGERGREGKKSEKLHYTEIKMQRVRKQFEY